MLLRIALLLALTVSLGFAKSEENISQQLDAAPGGTLVVDVGFGTIDVSSGANDKVEVTAHRSIETSDELREKEYLAEVPIVISHEGSTITIRARGTGEKSWHWIGNTKMDARYTVLIPKSFNLDLNTGGGTVVASKIDGSTKLSTSGGNVKLSDVHGPIAAKTSGGNIALSDCNGSLDVKTSGGEIKSTDGSGKLDARTSGGSIVVRDFKGDTSVKTSGGQLKFENIGGSVSGQTSGGSISAMLLSPLPGDVDLSSSAGSITLEVPTDAALNMQAHASSGTVSNGLPIVATRSETDELKGTMNGGGKSVLLRASAGSISLRLTSKTAMQ